MKCLWSDIRQVLGEYLKREEKKSLKLEHNRGDKG